MGCTRNFIAKKIISYIKTLGIEVKTSTKALGHQGFFRPNRIDISKNIPEDRLIPTLLHEFAHYVVYKIEPICRDFKPIFGNDNTIIHDELLKITNFVDKNSTFEKLITQKENIKSNILRYETIIKKTYPNFKRSESFKPFNKYSKASDIKYLEKHDAVKVLHWFKYKTYSIMNIENDFPETPTEFIAYLKLKSCQRHQAKISRKINKMKKYYNEPTELFARFIEALYIDINKVKELAPHTYTTFVENIYNNKYEYLRQIFSIVNITL